MDHLLLLLQEKILHSYWVFPKVCVLMIFDMIFCYRYVKWAEIISNIASFRITHGRQLSEQEIDCD